MSHWLWIFFAFTQYLGGRWVTEAGPSIMAFPVKKGPKSAKKLLLRRDLTIMMLLSIVKIDSCRQGGPRYYDMVVMGCVTSATA